MHAAGEAEQLQQILEMVWKKWDDIQWVNWNSLTGVLKDAFRGYLEQMLDSVRGIK